MRELTKSVLSYSWSMSVFGVQQVLNLLTPPPAGPMKAAQALNSVKDAALGTLDNPMKAAFQAVDGMQTNMVDMMFGGMMSGMLDPSQMMKMGSGMLQQGMDYAKQAAQSATDIASKATQAATGAASAAAGAATDAARKQGMTWGPPAS